jgi:hypothetical protein
MVNAYNPSWSGGRDQSEGCSLKPASGKQFKRPYLKKQEKAHRVALTE